MLAYMIILILMILLVELFSYILLTYDTVDDVNINESNEISERYGFDFNKLKADNKSLYKELLMYHPYRWYELKKNFKGNYITLDSQGFRNQATTLGSNGEIAFFGGSTAFSIYTLDDYTIPKLLSLELAPTFSVKNYGVGAYNSTAEMMTFMEVVRRNDKLKFAIFYDGVNEVGRHVEAYERNKLEEDGYFENIGHFHEDLTRTGIENSFGYMVVESKYKPNVLKLLDKYLFSSQVLSNSRSRFKGLSERTSDKVYEDLSNDIVSTYVDNVRTISVIAKEYGITPIFLWQPEVYTTKKSLSEQEKIYFNKYLGIKKLTKIVLNKISADDGLKDFNFYNISDALDHMGEESHFYDYCHVDREANQVISTRILSILNNDFFDD
jgi:hypothetical protein